MGLLLLLIFIGMPILEIMVFIDVGEKIGLFNTIAIVVLTAIAGTALLRWQGLSVLMRAQESLRENRFPMEEVFDGLCLVLAGALLLTPGFVTDSFGFLLFFPPVRLILKSFGARFIAKRAQFHSSAQPPHNASFNSSYNPSQPFDRSNGTIDGDYVDITDVDRDASEKAPKLDHKDQDEKP